MSADMLTAALRYRARGWSPIPFNHLLKKPALPKGHIQRYRKTPASSVQLRQWFEQTNEHVGLITGMFPYPCIVDVDGDEGRHSVKGLAMPPTPMVESGDGYHAYFVTDQPIPTSLAARREIMPGVDILALNHQVMAPPSLHPNGHRYQFHELLSLADLDLAPLPAWVIDLTHTTESKTGAQAEGTQEKKPRDLSSGAPVLLETDPTIKSLSPKTIRQLFGDSDANAAAAQFLGLGHAPAKLLCWNHPDTTPSMSLHVDQHTGAWKICDWHDKVHYALADIFARQIIGRTVRLTGPSTLVTWWKRLLLACKYLEAPDVPRMPLPQDARQSVVQVYEGFLLNVACHWLTQPGCAVPFTQGFAMAWCGMKSKHLVEYALYRLRHDGQMRPAGRQNGSQVFLPGKDE